MTTQCEHNWKKRKLGVCEVCAAKKVYMIFEFNRGYTWGPGYEEKCGQLCYWQTEDKKILIFGLKFLKMSI